MKKVLISGFDAFGKSSSNPSLEIIQQLPSQIGDFSICTLEIPTQAKRSVEILKTKIEELQPDYVINLGVASGREAISIERIAINVDDFRIPDNAGEQPFDQAIEEEGQDGYFSNLSIKALIKIMKEQGHSVILSNTAGTFVCNHVMYAMQHLVHTKYPKMKTGFVHVPDIDEHHSLIAMVEAICCLVAHLDVEEIKSNEGQLW